MHRSGAFPIRALSCPRRSAPHTLCRSRSPATRSLKRVDVRKATENHAKVTPLHVIVAVATCEGERPRARGDRLTVCHPS